MEPLKKFSPAFYGAIVILFFLPFVNLSCGGQTIMSVTGFQLITGTEINPTGMFGGEMNSSDELKTDQKKEIESRLCRTKTAQEFLSCFCSIQYQSRM